MQFGRLVAIAAVLMSSEVTAFSEVSPDSSKLIVAAAAGDGNPRVQTSGYPIEIVPSVGSYASHHFDISADGRFAAIADGNGAALWDLEKKRLVRRFTGLDTIAYTAALSTDGQRVAAAGGGHAIMVWDASTGRITATFDSEIGSVNAIAFSKDSRLLIYGGDAQIGAANKRTLVVREIETGRALKSFAGSQIQSIDVAPNGRIFAAGDWRGTVQLFEIDGRLIRSFQAHHNSSDTVNAVHSLSFSPDGIFLASGGNDQTAKIWDVASGKLLRTLSGHRGHLNIVHDIDWAPDSRTLLTVDSTTLRAWNATTGALEGHASFRSEITGKDEFLSTARFFPDGRTFLLNGNKIVDAKTLEVVSTVGVGRRSDIVLTPSNDSAEIMIATAYPRSIHLLNTSTGSIRRIFEDATIASEWSKVTASADRQQVIGLEDEHTLLHLDLTASAPPERLRTNLKDSWSNSISPDGKFIAVADHGSIVVLNSKNGQVVHQFNGEKSYGIQSNAALIQFSPDSRHLVSYWNLTDTLRIWDLQSGSFSVSPKNQTSMGNLSFAPDGQTFLLLETSFDRYQVDLWSPAGPHLIKRLQLPGEQHMVSAADFHPNGELAIIGGFDSILRLWNISSSRVIRTYRGHAGPINQVVFAVGGHRIVSSGNDGLKIWDADSSELLLSYVMTSSGQWVAITPEGFFDTSQSGSDALSVVQGLNVYSIDQLYQALYRPDLVHEKLAGDPKGLVREAAAKLDLDKVIASGMAPSVTVLSPRDNSSLTQDEIAVEAKIEDKGGGIGRVEWRVNGVTLGIDEGQSAFASVEGNRVVRSLPLDEGDNSIEIVAFNSKNLIASVPARVRVVSASSTKRAPRLFVVAVGINDYYDSRLRLNFPVADAKALAAGLEAGAQGIYESVKVLTVLDADAVKQNLEFTFARFAAEIHPRDVFVFFLAGHGKTVDGHYYFIPQDFRYDGENSIVERGISQDELQSWFARIAAKKSILLFDTCESGSLTSDKVASRGLEVVAALERLTRAMGRTVLSASTDDRPALEGYRGHGVFTYSILDALRRADTNGDGFIEVTELASFIDAEVPKISEEAFSYRQIPQMKLTGSNFPIARRIDVLDSSQTEKVTVSFKPTHVTTRAADVHIEPSDSRVSATLDPGTLVTLVLTDQGWVLVAKDGKTLGYVSESALATIH